MPTFADIDVSKHNFHSCIISDSLTNPFHQHFTMNKHGFNSFLNSISRFDPVNTFFAIESTGPYHFNLFSFLNSNGFNVVLINPLLISNFSKLNLRLTKTDKVDAYSIASYIQSFHAKFFDDSPHFKSYPSNLYPLKELSRKREELVNRKRKLVEDKATGKVPSMTIKEIVFINKEIEEIGKLMKEFVEQQDEEKGESFSVKEYIDILKSIPGISDVTAMQFISEVGDIKRFKNVRKLVAYAGVDPSVYQSGKYEGRGKISKRGNRHLRRVLWIMATSVVLHNKQIREYFNKVREHQPYKKAIMKVVHKLLRIIFAMLTYKRAYIPHTVCLLSNNISLLISYFPIEIIIL